MEESSQEKPQNLAPNCLTLNQIATAPLSLFLLKSEGKFKKKRKKNLTDVSADSFNVVIGNNALFFKIHFCSHFSGFLYKNANKICTGTDATPIVV